MTGVAFSPQEAKGYEEMFPSVNKVENFNTAKIDALQETFRGDAEMFYKQMMGDTQYEKLFPKYTFSVDDPILYEISDATDAIGVTIDLDAIQNMIDEGYTLDDILAEFKTTTVPSAPGSQQPTGGGGFGL